MNKKCFILSLLFIANSSSFYASAPAQKIAQKSAFSKFAMGGGTAAVFGYACHKAHQNGYQTNATTTTAIQKDAEQVSSTAKNWYTNAINSNPTTKIADTNYKREQ